MTRLFNGILLLALLGSAMYLVRVAYDARQLFNALDRAQSQARALEVEHERLKSEQQSQATPLRVERVAREKLAMRVATPGVTQYVAYAGVIAPVASLSVPSSSAASAVSIQGITR
jgi:cell division protein FtsL